jgi:hypothetical protein
VCTVSGSYVSVLKAQKKVDEAEPLCRHMLLKQEATLGTDHPDTVASIDRSPPFPLFRCTSILIVILFVRPFVRLCFRVESVKYLEYTSTCDRLMIPHGGSYHKYHISRESSPNERTTAANNLTTSVPYFSTGTCARNRTILAVLVQSVLQI